MPNSSQPSRSPRASWASSPAARATMRANKRKDTKPELAIRRLLHAGGFRYLVDSRPVASIRRTADIVFRGPKVAVFIDGCFWHRCPVHYVEPISNGSYWSAKIGGNVERDHETNKRLQDEGWRVLRYWEHELPRDVTADIIENCKSLAESIPTPQSPATTRSTID